MSRVLLEDFAEAFASGLPRGSVSYVDHEWLTAGGSPGAALSFSPDGEVSWRGHALGRLTEGSDPTAVAVGAFVRVANDAAAAAAEHPRGGVEVVGAGLIATHVRRLTGDGSRRSGDVPEVVVDTTGDPEAIRSALDRVSDLGMVVLAGESAGRLDLDLYLTVHRRGLVVVGVTSPREGIVIAGESDLDERVLDVYRTDLAEVSARASVPGDSLWYRFVS